MPDRALDGLAGWIVTDGKAGDELQCLGLSERLGLVSETRRVAPRRAYALLAPWGPADPRDPAVEGIAPDLLIASGRRAVPYLRRVRRASRGRTFTAFLKDPRTGAGTADFIWVAEHDDLRGDNVLATLTPPHRISPARLRDARARPDPRLSRLPPPRAAVLVGGDSRHLTFRASDADRLLAGLRRLAGSCSLMITASRRTPPPLAEALHALAARTGGFFWDGQGDNPYLAMLALAEAIVVTSDSGNLAGEAVCTGAPVLLFELAGTYIRHRRLFGGLAEAGALRPFTGRLETWHYEPIDATPAIAAALASAYRARTGAG